MAMLVVVVAVANARLMVAVAAVAEMVVVGSAGWCNKWDDYALQTWAHGLPCIEEAT